MGQEKAERRGKFRLHLSATSEIVSQFDCGQRSGKTGQFSMQVKKSYAKNELNELREKFEKKLRQKQLMNNVARNNA